MTSPAPTRHAEPPRPPRVRLMLALLTGAVLVTAIPMAAGFAQTRRLAEVVVSGEAARFREGAHDVLREAPPPPSPDDLARIVARYRAEGLRAVALFPPGRPPIASEGASPLLLQRCRDERGLAYALADDRVIACTGPLPPHPGLARAVAPFGGPPPGGPMLGGPPPGGPMFGPPGAGGMTPVLALEFEALAARDLRRARASLAAAGAPARAVMLATGLAAVRLLREREVIARNLAEARHLSSLGEMSAVLAHEIRNPLASLKGHAQLLAEGAAGDAKREARAARVVGEASRLEQLVDELLTFARTGRLDVREVRPDAWVRDVVAPLGPRVAVEVEGPPARWSLDAKRLGEALANVVRNALEAAPEGVVTVRVASEEGALVVEVRDRGPGIAPGEEEAIFEPFHTRKVRGTGLGLAIARRAAALHGGTLTARNVPGGGAAFRFALPDG